MGGSQSQYNLLEQLYIKQGAQLQLDEAGVKRLADDFKNLSDVLDGKIQADDVKIASVMGGGSYKSSIGGYDQLQEYGDSVYSKSKERLIRDIAKDVFSALKLQGSQFAEKASISDVVKNLEKVVPNPKKGKRFNKDFNNSKGKQKELCRVLANAINKHYGGTLVSMESSEAEMCSKVAEVMHSLFTGLHTEFMAIAGDVLRIVRNLEALKEFINASYKKQAQLVQQSGDKRLETQSGNVEEVYKRVIEELERQLAVLGNLVNVAIGPTNKSLVMLLEENRDFSGLVKDLKADLGTSAFGDKLAYLLSGVSSVAHSAELIDKALKKIGMSVQEFKSAKSLGDLRLKIYDHIQRKSPNSKELDAMMTAAEIIYKNDYSHDAIAAALSKKGKGEMLGGDCGCSGGDSGDGNDMDMDSNYVMGGDDDDDGDSETAYWAKKSLSKKIKKTKTYRDRLLQDFKKLLKEHYRNIVNAANSIAKEIGHAIPISDDLDRFINIFSNLSSLDKDNLYIALSGYPKDSVSREQRDNFMNEYHLLDVAVEPLVKGQGGSYFKVVQQAARDLVKTIDNFSDKIVKSVSEIHIDKPDEIRSALKNTANSFFGSADGGGGDDAFGSGSFVEFDKVKMEMRYYYSIANIKTNLSRVSEEMKEFGDDYEQVLGEEAAYIIDSIRREYQALLDDANPKKPHTAPIPVSLGVGVRNPATADKTTAVGNRGYVAELLNTAAGQVRAGIAAYSNQIVDYKVAQNESGFPSGGNPDQKDEFIASRMYDNLKELYTRQMNAKIRMVEVAQAIDLYLRSFADGIARNPDSIKSVIKMLDQVELVAKWFTERSGDNLATLFEFFPYSVDTVANHGATKFSGKTAGVGVDQATSVFPVDNKGNISGLVSDNEEHYYAWVEKHMSGGAPTLPGNPFLGRPLPFTKDKVKGLLTLSTKTVASMRALENILSAFATVGSKFGDLDLQSKTFMNPGQIFNALCEYVVTSAFTTGFLPNNTTSAAVYHGSVVDQKFGGAGGPNIPSSAGLQALTRRPTGGVNIANNALNDSEAIALVENKGDVAAAIAAGVANLMGNAHYGILTGVSSDGKDATTPGSEIVLLNKYTSIAMSAIPSDSNTANFWTYHNVEKRDQSRHDVAGWLDRFYDTDLLFLMTIKSIACKVFTVVDAYRLFNRPLSDKNKNQYDSLNPLRTILGGADGGGVMPAKIIPDALELYLRLPLLAEWYRDKFNTQIDRKNPGSVYGNTSPWRLTLVPSIDGIWSGIISLIFDKAVYVEQGNYTEPQVKKLIEEINDIYKHFKSKYPKATVRAILNSFVVEINRAFGFIKQAEIDEYLKDRRSYLNDNTDYSADAESRNFNNYDILSAEDQFGRNPAPSDKFLTVSVRQQKRRERNMVHLQEEMMNIRKRIDAEFRNYTNVQRANGGSCIRCKKL